MRPGPAGQARRERGTAGRRAAGRPAVGKWAVPDSHRLGAKPGRGRPSVELDWLAEPWGCSLASAWPGWAKACFPVSSARLPLVVRAWQVRVRSGLQVVSPDGRERWSATESLAELARLHPPLPRVRASERVLARGQRVARHAGLWQGALAVALAEQGSSAWSAWLELGERLAGEPGREWLDQEVRGRQPGGRHVDGWAFVGVAAGLRARIPPRRQAGIRRRPGTAAAYRLPFRVRPGRGFLRALFPHRPPVLGSAVACGVATWREGVSLVRKVPPSRRLGPLPTPRAT